MANPAGRKSAEIVETQALRQRRKKAGSDLTSEQKKLKRLLLGASSSKVSRAFDLGLRATNLPFLAAAIWAEMVRLEECQDTPERVKTTTRSKLFDLMRRIADRLDTGSPSIPDSVSLEILAPDDEAAPASDVPEVEGI